MKVVETDADLFVAVDRAAERAAAVEELDLVLLDEALDARPHPLDDLVAPLRHLGVVDGRLAGQPVTLARPHAYMNLSGGPVAALAAFYKLSPERIVVLHDELDMKTEAPSPSFSSTR